MECLSPLASSPAQEAPSLYLLAMAGPDKGAVFTLVPGDTLLGRSDDCTIPLAGRGVSRRHALLQLDDAGHLMLEDLNSTNGVFVDGKPAKKRLLTPGETLSLGPEVSLRLEASTVGVQDLLQRMYQSATTDPLTGLFNRRTFEERLTEEFSVLTRHKLESCLAIVDVDHFKRVNDTWGHSIGDRVLQTLAEHLKKSVRTGDLVGRFGGEEFVLYIRQSGLDGAITLLERLRIEVEGQAIALKGEANLSITISAGVVSLAGFDDWHTAFSQADEALYEAKAQGRNRVSSRLGPNPARPTSVGPATVSLPPGAFTPLTDA